jgi:hypothetical protein
VANGSLVKQGHTRKGKMMNRKFLGIVAIAAAVVVGQSSFSEACHRHRKARHARSAVVVQAPYYEYDCHTTNAYTSSNGCGCSSQAYGTAYNGAYQSGHLPAVSSQVGTMPMNYADTESRFVPGYSPSASTETTRMNPRANGTAVEYPNVPTPNVRANTGVGQ